MPARRACRTWSASRLRETWASWYGALPPPIASSRSFPNSSTTGYSRIASTSAGSKLVATESLIAAPPPFPVYWGVVSGSDGLGHRARPAVRCAGRGLMSRQESHLHRQAGSERDRADLFLPASAGLIQDLG